MKQLDAYQSGELGGSSLAWLSLTVSLQPVDYVNICCRHRVPRAARDSGISVPCVAEWHCHAFPPLRGNRWCSRTWNWQLALTLEEGSVGFNELVRRDIANVDAGHDGGVQVVGVVWIGVSSKLHRNSNFSICIAVCRRSGARRNINPGPDGRSHVPSPLDGHN